MYRLIDGRKAATEIKAEIAAEVLKLKASGKRAPHLAAILVGNDGGSETYVASKVKDCHEVGFNSTLIRFESTVTEKELLETVDRLNNDVTVDGFIVQLPLPGHISENRIIEAINPGKDADGFHPVNIGRMILGLPAYLPATPFGIIELLKRNNIETAGRYCVVIGRSNIVGRPLSVLMSQKGVDSTVTVLHSRSHNIDSFTRDADIIVAALGSPHFLKAEMVKVGAVVIDVGTTRVPDSTAKSGFRLTGDVDFENVAPKCSYITPVPGGVGPMTRVSLLKNTLRAALKSPEN